MFWFFPAFLVTIRILAGETVGTDKLRRLMTETSLFWWEYHNYAQPYDSIKSNLKLSLKTYKNCLVFQVKDHLNWLTKIAFPASFLSGSDQFATNRKLSKKYQKSMLKSYCWPKNTIKIRWLIFSSTSCWFHHQLMTRSSSTSLFVSMWEKNNYKISSNKNDQTRSITSKIRLEFFSQFN